MSRSSLPERITRIRDMFRDRFHSEPTLVVRAPGRANLLGEHTDYNDGFVLPMAIDRSVLLAAAPRPDRRVVLVASDFPDVAEFSLDGLAPSPTQTWSNYQRGVAHFLQARGYRLRGVNALFSSTVPVGSGLSSSAAVEMAMGVAFRALESLDVPMQELAVICQQAEHEYAGVPCGIMDQFISALGRRDHALLLDCRSLAYEHVKIPTGVRIVLADTGVRRELAASEYRVRRVQCEEAVRRLQTVLPNVSALRDVSPGQLTAHRGLLPDVVYRRARHVVRSTVRMHEAVTALRRGEAESFGQAMDACHESLRDDYEVSCPELEVMVAAAREIRGCYGSRLTGGGFGGCTVNLVDSAATEEFTSHLRRRYQQETGREASIITTAAADGAGVVWKGA